MGLPCPDNGDQTRNADKGDGSFDIVGERRQAEFGANIFQPAHQERALIHQLTTALQLVIQFFLFQRRRNEIEENIKGAGPNDRRRPLRFGPITCSRPK